MMHINLRSRTANKVFQQLGYLHQCTDFDTLFHTIETIHRRHYIPTHTPIIVSVQTYESKLQATKVIQSVAHKAIIVWLTWSHNKQWEIDNNKGPAEILCTITKDHLSVYINTSGNALYQRAYKTGVGDAPLKENIAAAMILQSKRDSTKPLLDPCCGSGTIVIEAALIASNKAPWQHRDFAFQSFPSFDRSVRNKLLIQAKRSQTYCDTHIQWRDIDHEVLQKAKDNADNAGVGSMITRKHVDMLKQPKPDKNSSIITNPPYGKRLDNNNIDNIHQTLIQRGKTHTTTFISSYDVTPYINKSRSIQATKNGAVDCNIYTTNPVL